MSYDYLKEEAKAYRVIREEVHFYKRKMKELHESSTEVKKYLELESSLKIAEETLSVAEENLKRAVDEPTVVDLSGTKGLLISRTNLQDVKIER